MDVGEKEKKQFRGGSSNRIFARFMWWSCFADVKLLLVLFLCTLVTTLHFVHIFTSSSSSSSSCLLSPSFSSSPLPTPTTHQRQKTTSEETIIPLSTSSSTSTSSSSPVMVTKRAFTAVGSAAYLFIQMGAYRTSPNSFAVIGLSSKPLHVYAHPQFTCQWGGPPHPQLPITASATKILPDWGFGRIYTVVVLLCSFNSTSPTGADGSGGRLVVHATTAGGDGSPVIETVQTIEALVEAPGNNVPLVLSQPPKYDTMYCGSPLYGNLSPQRVREWLAYHVRLFGERSHFVLYDAGGVHPRVADVLAPWMEKGYVTLHDIREQERFDGYYHNQFLVVNDCLHRYRFDAKWMFFFDVDEFVYVSPRSTLEALLAGMSGIVQFTFEQRPMSSSLCLTRDSGRTPRMWAMEKLVYRDVKHGIRRDRKYAIQPRNAFATGVHLSQNIVGKSLSRMDGSIGYFHYHGTVNNRHDPCKKFVDGPNLTSDGTPYVLDTTLRLLAHSIKVFELKMIGNRLQHTLQ